MIDESRLPRLPPNEADQSADEFLAALGSEGCRSRQRRHLERLAPWIAEVPRHSPPGRKQGQLRLRPRLGAVPWSRFTPAHAARARDRAVASCPTLKTASELLGPLRGTLRIALGRRDPGRLYLCLQELRVDGISEERREGEFWFDHEDADDDGASFTSAE